MLPEGYTLGHPLLDDARAVADLFNNNEEAFGTGEHMTTAEMLNYWKVLELDRNAWVIHAPDGEIVGYEELTINEEKAHFEIDGTVHPAHWNKGLGTVLLKHVEEHIYSLLPTLDLPATSPIVTVQINGKDKFAKELFKEWHLEKSDMVMKIEFDESPAKPQREDGITIRSFILGQDDRRVHEVVDRAFQSIHGYSERALSYERWREFSIEREGFDPSLWFMAVENEEIVGVCLWPHDRSIGWVRNFAVLPEVRGRGVGVTLMQHAFYEWDQRGQQTVGLAVQGDNIPAIRLYEKVGMQIQNIYETYQRELEMLSK